MAEARAKIECRVVPTEREDLPALTQIWHRAFADDRHTLMKMHEDGTTDFGEEMPGELLENWFESPKVHMAKALDVDGNTIGFTNWVEWNFDDTQTVKDPDSAFDAPLDILVDPNLPAVEQMRKLTSGHMFAMHDRMNRGRVLFACTFAVAPTAQGRGVGSALLRWATGLADAHGASAWVHLSDNPGGARALEKSGFREVNRLAFDLDHYATKPKPGGGKWGVYTFRYFHREVQAPE